MNHLFVDYTTSKRLKALGFDEPCFGLYNQIKELCYPQLNYGEWKSFVGQSGVIAAPTHQQVVDWFREKHKIEINNPVEQIEEDSYGCIVRYAGVEDGTIAQVYAKEYYETYNKAIDEAIKLIEK